MPEMLHFPTGNNNVNFSSLVKSLIVGFSSDDEMMTSPKFKNLKHAFAAFCQQVSPLLFCVLP